MNTAVYRYYAVLINLDGFDLVWNLPYNNRTDILYLYCSN